MKDKQLKIMQMENIKVTGKVNDAMQMLKSKAE